MLIALLDGDTLRRERWQERLARLGHQIATDGARPALVILGWPVAVPLGGLLAELAGAEATRQAGQMIIAGEIPESLEVAAAVAGAMIVPETIDDRLLGGILRLHDRLRGEVARRQVLEVIRDRVDVERNALRELAPFERDGRHLAPATGRYRAQLLLEQQAAALMLIAIDDLPALQAGAGIDAARDAERATITLIAALPARLGDMLHARQAGRGWGLWLPGTDRATAATQARQILDAVEARRLPNDYARAADCLTISIGIALAARGAPAAETEARAATALAHAASLGGNRIRWAD